MKKIKLMALSIVTLIICSFNVIAAPASDASIKELMEITHMQRLVGSIIAQTDGIMSKNIEKNLQGKEPTKQQQLAITKMKQRMMSVLKAEVNWQKLEPIYVKLYKSSFTEEEIKGMVEFYKTPAGKAVINKLPVVMQQTLVEVNKLIRRMQPKLHNIQQQFFKDFDAIPSTSK